MHINEVMTHPVITCPVDCTADVPARLMWEFDCGVIPLVDGEGRLAGIVTDRDLCMAAMTQARPLHAIAVTSAMARDVVRCHPDDPVETVERQMSHNRVRRVPVVDAENRPVGMVAMNDLARLALRAKRSAVDREVVRTLAEVCHPRGHAVPVRQEPARTDRPVLVSV
jgi:CBS domain-containing protein